MKLASAITGSIVYFFLMYGLFSFKTWLHLPMHDSFSSRLSLSRMEGDNLKWEPKKKKKKPSLSKSQGRPSLALSLFHMTCSFLSLLLSSASARLFLASLDSHITCVVSSCRTISANPKHMV